MKQSEWIYTGGIYLWVLCDKCGSITDKKKIEDIKLIENTPLNELYVGMKKDELCALCMD